MLLPVGRKKNPCAWVVLMYNQEYVEHLDVELWALRKTY